MPEMTSPLDSKDSSGFVVDAIVIGAGFSGLYMVHRLRNVLGKNVRAFEAGKGPGGTWYWNRYPGARCDSEGYVYCYSFDEQLRDEWTWSGKYPTQPELLEYLEHVADRFDLNRSYDFETKVSSAHFDDDAQLWRVTTDRGEEVLARFLITGIGHLSIAKFVPDIPGLDTFEGEWHHTSNWPENVDFEGKRVGIIGTGSTGVQAIPVIAEEAAHLVVFQRTPQYSIPARHESIDKDFLAGVKENYGEMWEKARWSAGGFPWQHNGRSALEATAEERTEVYEALWAEGGIKFSLGGFRDISLDRRANDTVSEFIRQKIREIVKDPEKLSRLLPNDHPFLSRRPIVDTNYFETYNRENVEIADIKHFPIQRIEPNGILTEEGLYELDIIVMATGFDAFTGPFFNMDIRGRRGVALRDKWSAGPTGYLGLQTSDFPNMFMITGPGGATGNLAVSIEHHVEWISDCLHFMDEGGYSICEAAESAESGWTEFVQGEAERSLIPFADSWYNGSNVPGKARAFVFYYGHFGKYRSKTEKVARAGYPGLLFDGDSVASEDWESLIR